MPKPTTPPGGGFYRYLDELRRELYLRYGRTEASPAIQGILEEAAAHLDDSFAELVDAGAEPSDATAEALARFGSARQVAHSYADVAPGPFSSAAVRQRLRGSPADPLEKETGMIALIRDLKAQFCEGFASARPSSVRFITESDGYDEDVDIRIFLHRIVRTDRWAFALSMFSFDMYYIIFNDNDAREVGSAIAFWNIVIQCCVY